MENNSSSSSSSAFRSGFVAIIGAPNAGKSTLLNRMINQKISITSAKPQTTRNRILGIVNQVGAQFLFVDTPGIFKAKSLLNRKIVEQAVSAVKDVDAILLVIDAASRNPAAENLILRELKKENKAVILVLNKIDLIDKKSLLPAIESLQAGYDYRAVVPVSAEKHIQIDELLEEIRQLLPEGPPLFEAETVTDASERFMVEEFVREKIFRLTGMEVPYACAVTVDSFKENKKRIDIHATIHVSRKSQKGIILGKKGEKIRTIGEKARKDIEKMTGRPVYLALFVRVTKDWGKKERTLKEFGY